MININSLVLSDIMISMKALLPDVSYLILRQQSVNEMKQR